MGVIDFMSDASYFFMAFSNKKKLPGNRTGNSSYYFFFYSNVMKMTGQAKTSHRSGEKKYIQHKQKMAS